VFDVYDISNGKYLKPFDRRRLIEQMGLKHVPHIDTESSVGSVGELLEWAEDKSLLNFKQEREGIVFKQVDGGMTFKAISNAYLIKQA
jgi:ATP-dependent RNA circularization protein (DNA/RNA ligase family)